VIEAVHACGKEIALSHYGAWNFKKDENGEPIQEPAPSFGGLINYQTFVKQLVKTGYDGYLVSEYCVPALDCHKPAGLEHVDLANKMALKFMKDLVVRHTKYD
jgi:sugar phosphate isomerase/epimerase